MIKQLRDKANLLLKSSNNDINNIKLSIIKKILEDDTCFFKMTIDEAYNILSDLGYTEDEIKSIYKTMISSEKYSLLDETN